MSAWQPPSDFDSTPTSLRSTAPLLMAGTLLGALADLLLRTTAAPPGLNMAAWIGAVAAAALLVHRRTGLAVHPARLTWLWLGVAFAAGLAWRDAPPLKLLALASATFAFALAAHRHVASWLRRAGVFRYAGALVLAAVHAWTGAVVVLFDASRLAGPRGSAGSTSAGRAAAVVRGLVIATPLVLLFGALFMAADAIFENLVLHVLTIDLDQLASHVLLFSIAAWVSTGYLRTFVAGAELPQLPSGSAGFPALFTARRPTLGITEVATVLGSLDALFMIFVTVQFRYLFGGDDVVQVTPDLTYAEYARRGFFELVFAVVLVIPILLAADWLLDRRTPRDTRVFRGLAGAQVALVLAVAASAFQRLRLYHASYGLTEARLYAAVLLVWLGAMLVWTAVTVLRGRRERFAFGALVAGLATGVFLFVANPDAVVARANLARMASTDARVRFDVAYATSLSGDSVPVLMAALPALPPDVQCPIARHMLRRWPPQNPGSLRSWSWSSAHAEAAVRTHEAELRAMLGPNQQCTAR